MSFQVCGLIPVLIEIVLSDKHKSSLRVNIFLTHFL